MRIRAVDRASPLDCAASSVGATDRFRTTHWFRIGRDAAVCIGAAVLMLAADAQPATELPKLSYDGLELVEGKRNAEGVAVLYVRPGSTLAAYKRVMLDPVEVAFDPSWMARHRRVSASDRERIRREVAEEFRIVFTEELEEKGGYKIVEVAGPDVLRVEAGIIDLYIQAPGVATPDRPNTYGTSTGRMTLVAELRDAESGAILARVADRRMAASSARMPGVLQWTTSVANRAEGRRILRTWADLLRKAFDSARDTSP